MNDNFTPLPADLPENWTPGQIVSPDGLAVGLTKQHGYNYLNKAVNDAQKGINIFFNQLNRYVTQDQMNAAIQSAIYDSWGESY